MKPAAKSPYTPLLLAVWYGRIEEVQALLGQGADPRELVNDRTQRNAFYLALDTEAHYRRPEMVQLLLNAPRLQQPEDKLEALTARTASGDTTVRLLVKQGRLEELRNYFAQLSAFGLNHATLKAQSLARLEENTGIHDFYLFSSLFQAEPPFIEKAHARSFIHKGKVDFVALNALLNMFEQNRHMNAAHLLTAFLFSYAKPGQRKKAEFNLKDLLQEAAEHDQALSFYNKFLFIVGENDAAFVKEQLLANNGEIIKTLIARKDVQTLELIADRFNDIFNGKTNENKNDMLEFAIKTKAWDVVGLIVSKLPVSELTLESQKLLLNLPWTEENPEASATDLASLAFMSREWRQLNEVIQRKIQENPELKRFAVNLLKKFMREDNDYHAALFILNAPFIENCISINDFLSLLKGLIFQGKNSYAVELALIHFNSSILPRLTPEDVAGFLLEENDAQDSTLLEALLKAKNFEGVRKTLIYNMLNIVPHIFSEIDNAYQRDAFVHLADIGVLKKLGITPVFFKRLIEKTNFLKPEVYGEILARYPWDIILHQASALDYLNEDQEGLFFLLLQKVSEANNGKAILLGVWKHWALTKDFRALKVFTKNINHIRASHPGLFEFFFAEFMKSRQHAHILNFLIAQPNFDVNLRAEYFDNKGQMPLIFAAVALGNKTALTMLNEHPQIEAYKEAGNGDSAYHFARFLAEISNTTAGKQFYDAMAEEIKAKHPEIPAHARGAQSTHSTEVVAQKKQSLTNLVKIYEIPSEDQAKTILMEMKQYIAQKYIDASKDLKELLPSDIEKTDQNIVHLSPEIISDHIDNFKRRKIPFPGGFTLREMEALAACYCIAEIIENKVGKDYSYTVAEKPEHVVINAAQMLALFVKAMNDRTYIADHSILDVTMQDREKRIINVLFQRVILSDMFGNVAKLERGKRQCGTGFMHGTLETLLGEHAAIQDENTDLEKEIKKFQTVALNKAADVFVQHMKVQFKTLPKSEKKMVFKGSRGNVEGEEAYKEFLQTIRGEVEERLEGEWKGMPPQDRKTISDNLEYVGFDTPSSFTTTPGGAATPGTPFSGIPPSPLGFPQFDNLRQSHSHAGTPAYFPGTPEIDMTEPPSSSASDMEGVEDDTPTPGPTTPGPTQRRPTSPDLRKK